MPDSVTRRMQTVNSNYDTDTWGLQTALAKTLGRHDLSAGFNASTSKTQRPFSQSPIPSVYSEIMQPEADSRSYTLGGFVQDKDQLRSRQPQLRRYSRRARGASID